MPSVKARRVALRILKWEQKLGEWEREPKLRANVVGANGLTAANPLAPYLFGTTSRGGHAELLYAELERRAVHSQARRGTFESRENPPGLFQCRQDMRTFGFFQSLVLPINLAKGAALKVSERDL